VNEDTKRHAMVVGFDYHGKALVELINGVSRNWSARFSGSSRFETLRALFGMSRADALICFGGPGPEAPLTEAARRRNVPVIVVWAGTDVVLARQDPGLLEVIKQYGFVNVSDGPWLVDELNVLGVPTRYVPVSAAAVPDEPTEFPKEFRVISYLPEPRRDFYGEKAVYAVARAFPEIPFIVAGRGAPNPAAPPNVEFIGYVNNMDEQLNRSMVLLRFPEHDGKSKLVLEALARGRHVIWNYDFPGVHKALSVSDSIARLRVLYEAHRRGALWINRDGLSYVRKHLRPQHVALEFEKVLNEAVASQQGHKRARRHRVAISGFNLFAAQVADVLQQSRLEWEPRLLRNNGNLERLTSLAHLTSADVWYSIGTPLDDRAFHVLARFLRKPRIIHWVGSDLHILGEKPTLAQQCKRSTVHNLAEVSWTIDELRGFGLRATLAPLPPRLPPPQEPLPLPDRFTVLLYLPQVREDFYGRREYERLFRAFVKKPVRFLVVGNGQCYAPDGADVTHLGWCSDLLGLYAQSTVLLRFTKHDGLSLMTLEALACGRHVLWTQEFPFTTSVRSYHDCEREVSLLLAQHLQGQLQAQTEAARFVRETYDVQRCIARIADVWEQAARPSDPVAYGAAEARP
jgi:glycosyltransferase involved in cell wall biosynthesis